MKSISGVLSSCRIDNTSITARVPPHPSGMMRRSIIARGSAALRWVLALSVSAAAARAAPATAPEPAKGGPDRATVLYQQEPVQNLMQHTIIGYTDAALHANPSLHSFFVDPSLNKDYGKSAYGHLTVAMWSMPANPLASKMGSSLAPLTGLKVPDDPKSQLGVDGGAKGINGLQMSGTDIGLSLAPRAITPAPFIQTGIPGYRWPENAAPRPFPAGATGTLSMAAYFRHPYTEITPVANHAIKAEGTVFYYFTLQFEERAGCSTEKASSQPICRRIWFDVRLYQDKFAAPTDPWALKDSEAISVDRKKDGNDIALIDSILRPSSKRITPCAGSGLFSLKPFDGEKKFCFELSAQQFESSLKDLNAGKITSRAYSTNPADYALVSWNVNVEAWAPTLASNPRIGLSLRDVTIKQWQ